MKIIKIIGSCILCFIGIIILAISVVFLVLVPYFYLQMILFARGDHLLFVSSKVNMIHCLMIMILLIYVFYRIAVRLFKSKVDLVRIPATDAEIIKTEAEIEAIKPNGKFYKFIFKKIYSLLLGDARIKRMFNVIKHCYIFILIISIYCGMTSYTILYTDSIKISYPLIPSGVIYNYNDIKNVDVGVEKVGKNSYSPYYKVTLSDGKSVDLFGGSMNDDRGKGFEYVLLDLDKKLRDEDIHKTVTKSNFDVYSKGLDKNFVSRVEKLFQIK